MAEDKGSEASGTKSFQALFRAANIRFSKCSEMEVIGDGANGCNSPSMARCSLSPTSCWRIAGELTEH